MVDYCLSFLNMEKKPFSERLCDSKEWMEPCTILWENGGYYVSAVREILPDLMEMGDYFKKENLDTVYSLTEKYIRQKDMRPDTHMSIIRCYDLTGLGEKKEACRLSGDEEDALFSDLSYLVKQGPLYGVLVGGKVVSLAGAVMKEGVANIHIETAPEHRKKGYAKACLYALCDELKNENINVLYECRSENTASVNTVRGIGGKEICRYVRFIGRK